MGVSRPVGGLRGEGLPDFHGDCGWIPVGSDPNRLSRPELFRRDREWNDGAAKAQLFTIFEALKPNDPVVLNGRRKLSSMIFA